MRSNIRRLELSYFEEPDQLKEVIVKLNKNIVARTNEPFIITNENQLDSAIGQVFQSWYSDEQKLAALFKSLILNHPFMNGNKRVAFLVLLSMRDIKLNPNELKNLTYLIAKEGGSSIEVNEIANVLFNTQYEVYNKKLDIFLDYDDEEEDEEESIQESSYNKEIEIALFPNILLELYEDLFTVTRDNLNPEYDYTAVSRVWVLFDIDNDYPEYWDLYIAINNEEILWDFLESHEIKDFIITEEDKKEFNLLYQYTI